MTRRQNNSSDMRKTGKKLETFPVFEHSKTCLYADCSVVRYNVGGGRRTKARFLAASLETMKLF